MAVIRAIHAYDEALKPNQGSDATEMQKLERWKGAFGYLASALAKRKVTFTYSIDDVTLDDTNQATLNTVEIKLSGVILKSTDPDIADVVLDKFYHVYISSDDAHAAKITKASSMTFQGTIRLEPDFSLSDKVPAGFKLVGTYEGLTLLIGNSAVLKIDGAPHKIVHQ